MPTTFTCDQFLEIFHEEILAAPRVSSSCKKVLRTLIGDHPDQPVQKDQSSPFDERETPPLVKSIAAPRARRKVKKVEVGLPVSRTDNIEFQEDAGAGLEKEIAELLSEGLNIREVVAAMNEIRGRKEKISYHSIQKIIRRTDWLYAMYRSDFTA